MRSSSRFFHFFPISPCRGVAVLAVLVITAISYHASEEAEQ